MVFLLQHFIVSLLVSAYRVDYVDCLGRTRRCLRKDLAYVKERDVKLFESLGGFDDKNKETGDGTRQKIISGEAEPELMSSDMRREMLRQKWEQQEEQLRNKTDIHYQDVLFDGKYTAFLLPYLCLNESQTSMCHETII